MNRITNHRLLALLPLLWTVAAMAQSDPMPQFRNPTAFVSSGSNAMTFRGWSARVGERVSSGASSGSTIYSTCAASNCADITGHTNITSSNYNSGTDQGIVCCSHTTLWDAAQDHRFLIITSENAGTDQLTINNGVGMPRIPDGYTSSIRLGDPRSPRFSSPSSFNWVSSSNNKSSEALFYTMTVTPQNALLFINYAVVARCYDHTPDVAGEFLIRVVRQNSDGTWPNQPINDSMWFRISAPPIPSSGVPDLPWVMGRPCSSENTQGCYCTSTTCAYVYKPWTKVAVSLNAFLFDNVRIEMYTSDCVPQYDPIYAYISGDYQAMTLTPTGCPDPESSVVDTLNAPSGMISYAWYVAVHGAVPDNQVDNSAYMDTVAFRQVWPPTGGTDTLSYYAAHLEDFVLEGGDTLSKQTFKCVMTSALDPSKPFESRIYANLSNRKPLVDYRYERYCDTSITFTDGSVVFAPEGQAIDSTHWVFYSDTLGMEAYDTVYGNSINYHFPAIGKQSVRLFVTTDGDPCTASELIVCDVLGNPPSDFTLSSRQLCESDVLQLYASEAARNYPDVTFAWAIDDVPQTPTTPDANLMVPLGGHRVSLTVTTPAGCSSTTYDSVTVFGQPSIDLSSTVAAICEGDSVTLSAAGSISYTWNSAPYDSTLANVQGMTTFTVHPTVTTTYFLLPSEDNPCSVDGAEVNIEVIPYPTPTIHVNQPRVSYENSTVTVQDVSPYAAASHWSFSDGTIAEGMQVTHNFADLSGDSVSIALHSCNRLDCCADTSVKIPIESTVVWFPNTFTPDNSSNNRFGVSTPMTLLSFEIFIYNRQGLLVHYSDDPNAPWDGTLSNGEPAPQGTYAWFCRYAYSPMATQTARGTVTLLR